MSCINGNVLEHGVSYQTEGPIEAALTSKRVSKIVELSTSRAIALCCVKLLSDKTAGPISVLDAINAFALPGLQWVKHINKDIKVTSNVAKELQNDICGQNEDVHQMEIVAEDPHVLMHSRKFKFIYIEAIGSAVTYLDAALRSINHEGLLCVTSTDIAILNNKSPDTALRLYGAKFLKSEYWGEMAVRVIAANVLRAAGRWGKGVTIEMCTVTEYSVTVVFHVLRGAKHVEPCLPLVQPLSHCLNCQARAFNEDCSQTLPLNEQTPLCGCGDNNTSALTQLGPMWSGSIFNPTFIQKLLDQAIDFKMSESLTKIFQLLLIDSVCCKSELAENALLKLPETSTSNQDGPPEKKAKSDEESIVIKLDDIQPAPLFYFDFQHHSVKGGNPPKLSAVVERLRKLGHRASKTHFGPRCVRTSASLQQFNDLLKQMWEEISKTT
uniref:tRNA (guanine(26)-N(2))-dimethyltransferase n=1 Tax=Phallusia mammillata TaxID=59560 RepID=A0A6F9DW81_9ASCI|nr:TRMT1-like protein [Phallusia mammillata]